MKPLLLTILSLVLLATGLAYAAQVYSYKCPRCELIETFDSPKGFVYCPNDHTLLLPYR
jgi:phage FluMu protein Com